MEDVQCTRCRCRIYGTPINVKEGKFCCNLCLDEHRALLRRAAHVALAERARAFAKRPDRILSPREYAAQVQRLHRAGLTPSGRPRGQVMGQAFKAAFSSQGLRPA